jgi:uncharacterized protein DUF559
MEDHREEIAPTMRAQIFFHLSPFPGRGLRLGVFLNDSRMSRARYLRKNATEVEISGITNSGRQHPIDRYILDFYCPAAKLAIELDGSGRSRL